MQYLILCVQLQTLHFHPKDLKFWFSKHKIPAAEQLSGWCLFGACQVLEAFAHKRRTWCLIRTSELDFCDMIKARGMQKALCRLNLGAQYQFWPTPHVCLACPSLLPFHLCLPNRYPYFCHPALSVPCCLVHHTCKPHQPLSPLISCLLGIYSFLHGASKDQVDHIEQRGYYTQIDCNTCSNRLQWVTTFN